MLPRSVLTLLSCIAIRSVAGQPGTPPPGTSPPTMAPSSFGGSTTIAPTPMNTGTFSPMSSATGASSTFMGGSASIVVGCYSTGANRGIDMTVFDITQAFTDPSGDYMGICTGICAGYAYMGVAFNDLTTMYQGTCYCGTTFSNGQRLADEQCYTDPNSYMVYALTESALMSDSMMVGCYLFQDFVLSDLQNVPPLQPDLPSTCVKFCASQGLGVLTITNNSQCNCGSSVRLSGPPTGTCTVGCTDYPYADMLCGGSDSSMVYILGSTGIGCFTPPATPNADAFISFGTSAGESSYACIQTCRSMDYPYAALSGGQCLCGADPDMSGYAPVDTTMPSPCTSECVDEKGSFCGGSDGSANIYRLLNPQDLITGIDMAGSPSSHAPDGPVKILLSNAEESDCPLYPCFWCSQGQMLEKGECMQVPADMDLIVTPGGPAFESYVGLGNSTSYYMSTHPCPASMWELLNTTYARSFIQTSADSSVPLGEGAMSASFTAYGRGVDIMSTLDVSVYPMTVAYIHETGEYELVDIENPPPDVMTNIVSVTLKLKDGEIC